jgi:hypothetical protein
VYSKRVSGKSSKNPEGTDDDHGQPWFDRAVPKQTRFNPQAAFYAGGMLTPKSHKLSRITEIVQSISAPLLINQYTTAQLSKRTLKILPVTG